MDFFSPNDIKNIFKNLFDYEIYERGVYYNQADKVLSLKVYPREDGHRLEVNGEIEGGRVYCAGFVFDTLRNRFRGLECDCPCDFKCKHLAALGIEFIYQYNKFFETFYSADSLEQIADWINKQSVFGGNSDDPIKNLKQNLEKIGIDPDFLSNDIIKKLVSSYQKSENKADFLKPRQAPVKKPNKIKKIDTSKFHILMQSEPDLGISLRENGGGNGFESVFWGDKSKQILNRYKNSLTDKQKELLEAIKRLNNDSFIIHAYDCGDDKPRRELCDKILSLLPESDFVVKFKKDYDAGPVKVNFVDGWLPCSRARLFEREKEAEKSFAPNKEFVFELRDKQTDSKKLVCGYRYIFHQKGKEARLYKTSPFIVALYTRAILNSGWGYGVCNPAVLNENEILNINEIIAEAGKCFNLETDLKPDYKINKFDKAKECVEVDFDSSKPYLNVKAVVDYGFHRQNVGESVYKTRQKGVDKWHRKEEVDAAQYVIKIKENNINYAPVKAKKEIKLFKQFSGLNGFSRSLKLEYENINFIMYFYQKHWQEIKKICSKEGYDIVFTGDKFEFEEEDFKADFEVDLNAENDWLAFDVDCYCGKDKIGLEDLKKYLKEKKSFIKTSGGRLLRISNPEELERFIMMLESFYARENGGFEGKLYHAPELDNIFTSSEYYNGKTKDSFKKFVKEAKSGRPVKKIRLSASFDNVLRDYQKEGVNWFYFLRKYRFAGILADDMGLGKTLQTLTLLDKEKVKDKPSLVVCPKSLLYNWSQEAEKFAPKLKSVVVDGSPAERQEIIKKAKKYDLLITGYASVQKDFDFYQEKQTKFNYCVLDEAQFIKNHKTKNARIIKQVNADYRLALTGTPLENNVSEIWSMFDFLMPGFLGKHESFVKRFEKPIMKESDRVALERLRNKVKCFMLRRTKGEVLKEIPPKIEQQSLCKLEQDQNILYQEILANVKSEIFETVKKKGFNQSRIHILAGLIKLRQVCNHPVLLLKDKKHSKYKSAKLDLFLELTEEIINNGGKVLVFSQFTKMLDILGEELKARKVNYHYLSGKTKDRQKLVEDFNRNEKIQVFLISLKAGGTGLNLTSADNVIIFDPWWNPSVENQAIDRAHRIGQKKSVNVYRLITKGTIEERIVKLQEKKKFLFDNIVGESKDMFSKLTWEDVQELFRD